nr:endoglin [Pogona vitticeps]
MKMVWHLAGLLLASGAMILSASPATMPSCTLQPLTENRDTKVLYTTSKVTSGCTSRGPEDLDVHVLYLNTSKLSILQLNLNVAAAARNRKTVFVLNSVTYAFWKVNMEDHQLPLSFAVSNGHINATGAEINSIKPTSSSHDLLAWAKAEYGGVSSFAELETPESINFHVGKVLSSNEDCVPGRDFDAKQYLEASFASHNIRSCLPPGGHHEKEAHILWLKQPPPESGKQEVGVDIKVTCRAGTSATLPEMLLVLKSHDRLLWSFGQMPGTIKLAVSGKYSLKMFNSPELEGEQLPASEEGLIQAAHGKDFASIASFTEVPSAKSLTLELVQDCVGSTKQAVSKPPTEAPSLIKMIQNLVTECQPWRCLDNTMEIALPKDSLKHLQSLLQVSEVTLQDASCKTTDNSTHFVLKSLLESCSTAVEGGVLAKNKLVFSLAPLTEKVTVPFECTLPEKVFLQLYPTPDFSSTQTTVIRVNEATYVQLSLRTANKEAEVEVEDCSLYTSHQASPQLLISRRKPQSYAVKFLTSPSPKIHRFSFVYKVAGEQWSVAPATLVCRLWVNSESQGPHEFESVLEVTLKNPNIPIRGQELKIGTVLGITFGAFLIGVLLTGALWYIYSHTRSTAKRPPVSADPPASESGSTNPSIGSTQSTPCSTSSMA